MACDDVLGALAAFNVCLETPDGSRITTHCVYPSFDPVNVFVSRFGDGFRVHDGGGAHRAAWAHGKDDVIVTKALKRWAARYYLAIEDHSSLHCTVQDASWLTSAILAVANASSGAANEIVEHIAAATETALKTRIFDVLSEVMPRKAISREFGVRGASGKLHSFDFAIKHGKGVTLLDAVAPHHVSIAAKYVAFADAGGHAGPEKYAVFDRELDTGDTALLQQVADLIPFSAMRPL
ncbi:MAG TPA: hypothetical protein VFS01_09510, partial [Rhizomicrobium sp.]|nr:hypothetical protein [Rhizomicrobium sp.]